MASNDAFVGEPETLGSGSTPAEQPERKAASSRVANDVAGDLRMSARTSHPSVEGRDLAWLVDPFTGA